MATPRAAQHRDLGQELDDIKRRLRELASAALRRPKFDISEGDLTVSGGDLVVDGGDFLLLDTDGSTVFRLGPQTNGDRGVSIFREDGVKAFECAERFGGSTFQSVSIYNADGSALLQEEELGDGLSAPFFPIPMRPYLAASGAVNTGPHGLEAVTSATSFTTVHEGKFPRQNQFMRFQIAVKPSDTTTSAEVRIINADTGVALGAFLQPAWLGTVPTGSSAYTVLTPDGSNRGIVAPGTYAAVVRVAIQVRRTAGAGSLTVAVPYAHGCAGTY